MKLIMKKQVHIQDINRSRLGHREKHTNYSMSQENSTSM